MKKILFLICFSLFFTPLASNASSVVVRNISSHVYNSGVFWLEGENFGNAYAMASTKVLVDNQECNIYILRDDYIECKLPNIGYLDLSEPKKVSYSVKFSSGTTKTGSVYYGQKISDDNYSMYQTYLKQVKITDVWNNYSGSNVVVAVIDDGVDIGHPDLKNNIWRNQKERLNTSNDDDNNGYKDDYYGYNFIDNNANMIPNGSHGTAVAGIIAAQKDNFTGVAGIAPSAKIMPLIACNEYGCPRQSVIEAIRYAVDNGAHIINLSLGGESSLGYTPDYDNVIKYAYDKNVLIVAAAGNGDTEGAGIRGQDLDKIKASPVCNDGGSNMVLGVGSIDKNNRPSKWSNYGKNCIDISAPGKEIMSTVVPMYHDGYSYTDNSGTSFSAPIITGVAALLKEKNPGYLNFELINHIISRSDYFDNDYGVNGKILNAKSIIENNSPLSEILNIYPSVIDDNSKIITINGKYFSKNIKIKFYNNEFIGVAPYNSMNVSSDKIIIDISKWPEINKYPGVFSLSIEQSNNSLSSNKYTVNNAVDIRKMNNISDLSSTINSSPSQSVNGNNYVESQRSLLKAVDKNLSNRVSGKILLQIEDNGEGWYVNPSNNKRYYLGRPSDAFSVMRGLGLGISNKDFDSFKNNIAPKRLSGRILIKVEDSGKAYYVNPDNLKMHSLGRPNDAFNVMRSLGLGINNDNIRKIDIY